MGVKLGDLFVQIGADPKPFLKELKDIGKPLNAVGKEFKKLGFELTKSVSLPIAGFGALALKNSRIASAAFGDFHEDIARSLGHIGDEIFKALDLQSSLNAMAGIMRTLAKDIESLPGPLKGFAAGVVAVVAQLGPAIYLFGELIQSIAALKQITFAFARTPLGLLVSGLVLAGTALYGFALASRSAASTQSTLAVNTKTTKERLEDAKKALEAFSEAEFADRQKKIDGIKAEIEFLGKAIKANLDATEVGKRSTVDLPKAIRRYEELSAELGKLEEIQAASSRATLEGVVATNEARRAEEDFLITQSHINTEFDLSASALEIAEKRLDNYKKLYEEWIKLLPASDEHLQNITKAMRDQAAEVTRLKEAQEAQVEAKRLMTETDKRYNDSLAESRVLMELGVRGHSVLRDELERDSARYRDLTKAMTGPDQEMVALQDRISALNGPIGQLAIHLQETMLTTSQFIIQTVDSISQGIGNAVAQIIVYGADVGQVFEALGKQILASIVSSIVQIIIEFLIFSALAPFLAAKTAAPHIGASLDRLYVATVAGAVESQGLLGLATGPIIAAIAVGAAASTGAALGAAAGSASAHGAAGGSAAATGGIFRHPSFISVAENPRVGPELVLNQKNVDDFFGGGVGGRGDQTIVVELDGRPIMRHVVRGTPRYLRLHGVPG